MSIIMNNVRIHNTQCNICKGESDKFQSEVDSVTGSPNSVGPWQATNDGRSPVPTLCGENRKKSLGCYVKLNDRSPTPPTGPDTEYEQELDTQ